MYYFTLFITPMTLLCGVFFPIDQLPPAVQAIAQALPLTHSVALIRPLLAGALPAHAATGIGILSGVSLVAFVIALRLTRRRLLS
jgi:lipooligosaccharide transport system permease protein